MFCVLLENNTYVSLLVLSATQLCTMQHYNKMMIFARFTRKTAQSNLLVLLTISPSKFKFFPAEKVISFASFQQP